MSTLTDDIVQDIAGDYSYFIVGIPYGKSENGNLGGRVFFGKIR
jgi:hypothetical protein